MPKTLLSDDKKAFHCIALSKKLEEFTLGQLVLPGRLPFLKPKVNWLLHLLRKHNKKTGRKHLFLSMSKNAKKYRKIAYPIPYKKTSATNKKGQKT